MNLLTLSYAGVTAHEYSALIKKSAIVDRRRLAEKISYADRLDPAVIMKELKRKDISYVTINNPGYPELLKEIFDPPFILYYRGRISFASGPHLGVVGSRKATGYSRAVLNEILPKMKNEISIVSGLAYGADEMAHQAAMKAGLKTIGVLAFGHDVHYPSTTRKIRAAMEEDHLVISEYPPHTGIEKWRFVARNRIIAGLSHGVLVTEAEEKSGSLITLDMALNENRIAYCVPGNITSKLSAGTNLRLQEGAKPVLGIEDISEDFNE